MNRITVKSKFLDATFILEISSSLLCLDAKSTKVKMVQVHEEGERNVIDYFVFEENDEGEWIMKLDKCFVSAESRIKSIYISLLVLYKKIYLGDFIEDFEKNLK